MLSVVENAGLRWHPRMLVVGASEREPTGSCTRTFLVMEVTTRHPAQAPWGSEWMVACMHACMHACVHASTHAGAL
eukprot:39813-Chlamydomonas_euryale.AAC.5